MQPITVEQLKDKIKRHELKGAKIYEGKLVKYETGRSYFDRSEGDNPEALISWLDHFAANYPGRYTFFGWKDSQNPSAMISA